MNDKVYIHEFIDIRGHHRASYMHHMAANWSPIAQERRNQLCYGVWAILGSTGPWPQVLNIWEEPGWEGLAESFGGEAVGAGAQDPILAKWWAKASEFRRGADPAASDEEDRERARQARRSGRSGRVPHPDGRAGRPRGRCDEGARSL